MNDSPTSVVRDVVGDVGCLVKDRNAARFSKGSIYEVITWDTKA